MGKHGRPSQAEQLHIEKTLRSYFEKMLSPSFAARDAGININTVKKYYRVFSDEIRSSEHPDFIQRSKNIIQNCSLAFDVQLSKLYTLQDKLEAQINQEIKQKGKIPPALYKISIRLSTEIAGLLFKKANLTLSPTADITLSRYIKESGIVA
jgi:hypothetical protein